MTGNTADEADISGVTLPDGYYDTKEKLIDSLNTECIKQNVKISFSIEKDEYTKITNNAGKKVIFNYYDKKRFYGNPSFVDHNLGFLLGFTNT